MQGKQLHLFRTDYTILTNCFTRKEVNFIKIRQLLAQGHEWNDELIEVTSPNYQKV